MFSLVLLSLYQTCLLLLLDFKKEISNANQMNFSSNHAQEQAILLSLTHFILMGIPCIQPTWGKDIIGLGHFNGCHVIETCLRNGRIPTLMGEDGALGENKQLVWEKVTLHEEQ